MESDISLLQADVDAAAQKLQQAQVMISRQVVGQKLLIDRLLMGLIADGHVLLEGLPGLAKTTAVKAVGAATKLNVSRIQFTPDLLPADVTGTQVYDPKTLSFVVKKGPIFANIVLADEINRAPAKVQAALLEAMQERQVTIGEQSFVLEQPFLVLATQNPLEQEGTYALPEAQVDRFLFKVKVGYSTLDEEVEIVARQATGSTQAIEPVWSREDILRIRALARKIHVADKVRRYMVELVFATRAPEKYNNPELKNLLQYGGSPRASISLEVAARVQAILRGRPYVTPQDVKDIAGDVLRHRIIPTYEAEAEGVSSDDIIRRLMERVDVP